MQRSQEEVFMVVFLFKAMVMLFKQHNLEGVRTFVKRVVAESFLASVHILGFPLFHASWLFHFS